MDDNGSKYELIQRAMVRAASLVTPSFNVPFVIIIPYSENLPESMKNCEQFFLDIIVLNKDSSPHNTQSLFSYFTDTQDAFSKFLTCASTELLRYVWSAQHSFNIFFVSLVFKFWKEHICTYCTDSLIVGDGSYEIPLGGSNFEYVSVTYFVEVTGYVTYSQSLVYTYRSRSLVYVSCLKILGWNK